MANPVNPKWRIAAVVLAIAVMGQGFELFRIRSSLKDVFHYDVRVTLKDKNTGEVLRGGSIHGPESSSSGLIQQSSSFGGGIESRSISGIAYEPREFGFRVDGYKRGNVVVTKDTPWSVTLELEPGDPSAEQGGSEEAANRSESDPESNKEPEPQTEGSSR